MAIKYPLSLVVQVTDKATGSLAGINAKIGKLTQPIRVPLRRLGNSLTAFSKEAGLPVLVDRFKGVGSSVKSVAQEAESLGKKLAGVTLLAGGLAFGLIHSSVEAGDKLGEMSQRLGISANGFAQLRFAAEQSDVEQEQFTSGMDRLNRSLGEMRAGGGQLFQFLNKVSPTLARQVKAADSTSGAFYLLVRAFEKLEDPAKRAALAAVAFGKGNLQMGQFAGMGEGAIDALRKRFGDLAGDQELFAKRSGDSDNAMRESRVALEGLRNAAVTGFLPAVTTLSTALADFLAKNRQGLAAWAERTGAAITAWVEGGGLERLGATLSEIGSTIAMVVDKLGGFKGVALIVAGVMGAKLAVSVGGLIVSLGQLSVALALTIVRLGALAIGPIISAVSAFVGFVRIIYGAATAMGIFNLTLLANPITWVVLAVVALAGAVYLIYKNWGPISGFFKKVWGGISDGVVKAWGGIRDFFSGLWDDIVGFFRSAWEKIKPIVDVMMDVAKFTSPIGLAVEAGKSAGDWWQSRNQPSLGAAGALPAAAGGGETRVVVDFNNVPKGVRVAADPQGDAPLDLSLGYSMVTP
jgi:hypothetical protein